MWIRWVTDEDGDVGIEFFGLITFIKYKYSTLIRWRAKLPDAGKWQGNASNAAEKLP